MQPAIDIPLFLAYAPNYGVLGGNALATGNLASIEWHVPAQMPTQSFEFTPGSEVSSASAASVLSLVALAESVLADSRPLTDWERKDTDEYFWSQFA
jgi:hypothetical protein